MRSEEWWCGAQHLEAPYFYKGMILRISYPNKS